MADRVHPTTDSPRPSTSSTLSDTTKPPSPPPGTYVIQLPKDQIYRVPPPENAHRFQLYTRKNNRHNRSRSCLFWLLGTLTVFIILLGIAVAVFYLIVRPKSPNYSIDAISISGLNLTSSSSSSSAISPVFNLTVRADNPNKKIGIYYLTGSSVGIYFSNEKLSDGVLPDFFQPSKNVSVFRSFVRGSGVKLSSTAKNELIDSVKRRAVVLKVEIGVPIKVKIGAVKSWKMRVKVNCDVTVDELTAAAKIVAKNCDYSVKIR